MTFSLDGTVSGYNNVGSDGDAVFQAGPGTYLLTAHYNGDQHYAPADLPATTITVAAGGAEDAPTLAVTETRKTVAVGPGSDVRSSFVVAVNQMVAGDHSDTISTSVFATTESGPAVEVPLQTLSGTVHVTGYGGSLDFELDAPTTGLSPGAYALVYQVTGAGSFATVYSRNLVNVTAAAPAAVDTPIVDDLLGPDRPIAAGGKRRRSAVVSVPNPGTGDTVAVYATATGAIDASSTLLGAVRKRLPVRSGQATAAVSVPMTTASVPAGSYVLLARVTDAAGTATDATAGPVVPVGQPAANLGGTITKVTPFSRVGGPVAFTLTLTNFGNVAAVGPASLTVSLTGTDLAPTADVGLTAPILVRKLTRPLTIGPGRSANLRFQLRVPAAANGQNLYPLVQVTGRAPLKLRGVRRATIATPSTSTHDRSALPTWRASGRTSDDGRRR